MATPSEEQPLPEIQYVEDRDQELINGVASSINEATGEQYQVEPTTERSKVDGDFGEFVDRAIKGRPGHSRSSKFLNKLKARITGKNPGSIVKESI